jgi:hypothetical protein
MWMAQTDLKPGYRTTEFAAVLASLVVTILVLAGVINAEDEARWRETVLQMVLAIGTLLSNAAIIVAYIRSRTALKAGG